MKKLILLLFCINLKAQQYPQMPEDIDFDQQAPQGGAQGPGFGQGMPDQINPQMQQQQARNQQQQRAQQMQNQMMQGQMGIPSKTNYPICPFNSATKEVSDLLNETTGALISLKMSTAQNCQTLSNGAQLLSESLKRYQDEQLKNYVPQMGPMGCVNYNEYLQMYYEQVLFTVAHGYEITFEEPQFMPYMQCSSFLNQIDASYEEGAVDCVTNVYASLVAKWENKCQTQSVYMNKSDELKRKAEAKTKAISEISNQLKDLGSKLGGCSNSEIKSSTLTTILNISTLLASASSGPLGAIGVSLGSSYMSDLINSLYGSTVDKDLKRLNSEKDYANYACLYLSAMKTKCDQDLSMNNLKSSECSKKEVEQELNPASEALLTFSAFLNKISDIEELEQLKSMFNEKIGNKSLRQTLTEIKDALRAKNKLSKAYLEMENLEALIKEIERTEAGIEGVSISISEAEKKVSPENVLKIVAELEKIRKQEIEKLKKATTALALINIAGALEEYEKISTNELGIIEKGKQNTIEAVRELVLKGIREKANQDIGGNDERKTNLAISVMVNNFKDLFEDKLKSHYENAIKTAKARKDSKNKEEIFNSFSALLNDCLLAQGMFYMDKSKGEEDLFSPDKLTKNKSYDKYCAMFMCADGIDKYNPEKTSPDIFRSKQCSNMNKYFSKKEALKKKFLETGSICGNRF